MEMQSAEFHLEMRRFIWRCRGSFGDAEVHLEMQRLIWRCRGSFGDAEVHLEMQRFTWRCRGSCGDLLALWELLLWEICELKDCRGNTVKFEVKIF